MKKERKEDRENNYFRRMNINCDLKRKKERKKRKWEKYSEERKKERKKERNK